MLYDKDFLLKLDKCKNKTIYAKITALTFDENPIQTIEGRVTQGSINIDGASAVRRTCSLTIAGQNFDYNNYYWGLNTKFKLEIGVQNYIDSNYPEIIWFKQGIYLISGFNTSRSTTNFSISISGKDKMCLLNGEIGGALEASVDFGTVEEEIDNVWIIKKIPLYDIIRNVVHTYGGEPYHNIIINDLNTYGKELLEYRLEVPAYIYKKDEDTSNYNIFLDGKTKVYHWNKKTDGSYEKVLNENGIQQISALEKISDDCFDLLIDSLISENQTYRYFSTINDPNTILKISKIQYGDTIGYKATDLTFAGDLIANVGETITSVLDKIKNMLVEFEYFYDLDGRFVFQKRKNYINTLWGPEEKQEENLKPIKNYSLGDADYVFSGAELITAFNNNLNLLNIRNDFSIWGERTAVSGAKIPIHLRYAIDNKPTEYTTIAVSYNENLNNNDTLQIKKYNEKYRTKIRGQDSITYSTSEYDWREIIYRMALDYYKYNFLEDFELKVAAANPVLYPTGRTGYENYYTDLQGFWRELYNPNPKEDECNNYYLSEEKEAYWNKLVYEQPYNLNFWFDFLDTQGELKQFGVKSIGSRPKSIKDTNVKAIYFRDTPNIQFDESQSGESLSNHSLIQVPEKYQNIFSISAQGKSAKERLDELLYAHGYCNESATITTIPIYYLEPNSRIYINDPKTNIIGYYNVSKITLPLTYNGTMSLTATKVYDN